MFLLEINCGNVSAAYLAWFVLLILSVLAAYEMVSAYCQGFQGFTERSKQDEFSFVQEEVEKVFIADHKGALLA